VTAALSIDRVTTCAAATDPAVGVHWTLGERVGFLSPPAGWPGPPTDGKVGMCWDCRTAAGAHGPLCNACGRALWGDEVYAPAAMARAAIARPKSIAARYGGRGAA
jgi:hypothetical protein